MVWIILLAFATIVAIIAHSKGRSAVGWFIVGFLLTWIALIIICVVSNLKKEQEKEERLRGENRRLREQLRKDRMVANRRHQELHRRINAHDQVQGIDTAPREQGGLLSHDDEDNSYAFDDGRDDEDEGQRAPIPRRSPRRARSL